MAQRKSFLLRIDPAVLEALQRWADQDLRSLNGQIEFVLRRALGDRSRGGGGNLPARPRADGSSLAPGAPLAGEDADADASG